MESVQSANVDTAKFLALEESKATTTNPKWNCCDFTLKMLEEGIHADIKFNAKGGSVKAHKNVLACVSPVFNAMFQHDMKEKLTSIVDIPDMSIEALQLFLLLLYTTNKVGDEVAARSQLMTDCSAAIDDIHLGNTLKAALKNFRNIHEAVLEYQMPPFSAAIDKHFDEFHKAVLKYQVESRLGYVLIPALARNLTLENCWYYYGSLAMAAPGAFKSSAYRVCTDYVLGNYHDVIKSKCFLEEMRCNPGPVRLLIMLAESRDTRKEALEGYLRIKRL